MALLRLLSLLAVTTTVAVGQLCPKTPFNDISESVRQDCVNGNRHLYCANDAPITVEVKNLETQFDDVVAIGGTWFGLKCGADAIILDAVPTVSCPPAPCGEHTCTFVNPGGLEPKTECKNGNLVKSCTGNLFLGTDEYSNAACSADGQWIAWDCEGEVEVINGTLEAACSATQCTDPVLLNATAIAAWTLYKQDNSELKITHSGGQSRLSCGLNKQIAYMKSDVVDEVFVLNPLVILMCTASEGQWMKAWEEPLELTGEYNGTALGCITYGCSPTSLLDGTEIELKSFTSKQFVKTAPAFNFDELRFEFSCPTGSTLGYIEAGAVVISTTTTLTCGFDGWTGTNATHTDFAIGSFKYGCFATTCATKIIYMQQSDVATQVGVTVDTTQEATLVDGSFQLKCAAGSQFAYMVGTTVTVATTSWMSCAGAAGWAIKVEGQADIAYTQFGVGCIKPTCTGMLMFDGTEPLIVSKKEYKLVPTLPSYVNGKWELVCPSDCSIGYAEQPTKFQFSETFKITCDAAGWWMRASTNDAGVALAPVKVGCFKKIVVPAPKTCRSLTYIKQDMLTSYTGVYVDLFQRSAYVEDFKQFKCAAGSQFAYMDGGQLFAFDWWMTCLGVDNGGWRMKDGEDKDSAYANEPVGCIKPSCVDIELFDGSETLLIDNPLYQLVPTLPTYASGRFGLICPSDCSIGYDVAGSFVFDATVKITCEGVGWWIKSQSIAAGSLLTLTKFGCFRKLPNCPQPLLINQTQITAVGVSVDTTQGVSEFTSGFNQLKCKSGTALATLSPTFRVVDWYLKCDTAGFDGWRVKQDGSEKNGNFDGSAVACIKPTCTGMVSFTGTEQILTSNPAYQLVGAANYPSYKDGKFELVCPSDCGIGYAENATKFTFDNTNTIRVTCEAAGWWVKTATNGNGVALSTAALGGKIGCFKRVFVPTANCPIPLYLNQSLVSSWVGITVDTVQTTAVVVSGINQVKCGAGTVFAYLTAVTNGVLTRQDWWMSCDTVATAGGWRIRDAGTKNTAYGVIPVGCLKPTCTGLQMFYGNESILGSYSNYQVVPTIPSMPSSNGKFLFKCPAGSTLGMATDTTISLDAGLAITCEAAGWWMKTTANAVGALVATSRVGCFKTIIPPVLPTQCQTGINFFLGDEKILRDHSEYAFTEAKTAAVNGQWKLNCPAGSSIGYLESSNKFLLGVGMNVVCGASGWMLTSIEDTTGIAFTAAKVGCFAPVTCPKSALSLFTGTETIVSTSMAYSFTGDGLKFKDGKAKLSCSAGAAIGFGLSATSFSFETSATVSCESTGWWVKTAENTVGYALASVKVGCFKPKLPSKCASMLMFDGTETELTSSPSCQLAATAATYMPSLNKFQFNCPKGAAVGYVKGGVIYRDTSISLTCDETKGWIEKDVIDPIGHVASLIKFGCFFEVIPAAMPTQCQTGLNYFLGTEQILKENADYAWIGDEKAKLVNGEWKMSCPAGTEIGFQETETKFTYSAGMKVYCAATGWWMTTTTNTVGSALTSVKIGCFKTVTCPKASIQFFDGTESIVTGSKHSCTGDGIQYWNSKPRLVCPANTVIGFQSTEGLVVDASMTVTCETAGWTVTTSANPTGYLLTAVKIGCFKPKPPTAATCPLLSYLPWSIITSTLTIDAAVTTFTINGVNQFMCPIGSYFATMLQGTMLTSEVFMTCDGLATGGWRMRDTHGKDDPFVDGTVAVGCIRPTCTGMLLFDGTETLLASNPSYSFIAVQPAYKNGDFEFACPSDYTIGFAETETKFAIAPAMKITCEAAGWWVTYSTSPTGIALASVKIGCFKKPFVPSDTCYPLVNWIDEEIIGIHNFIGITPVPTPVIPLANGVNRWECLPGTMQARIWTTTQGESVIREHDGYMWCDPSILTGNDVGWMSVALAMPDYNWITFNKTIGCLKPTCTELQLFDGTESILADNRLYTLVAPYYPSWGYGRFTIYCPRGAGIGYFETPTTFKFDINMNMNITCETTGWWMVAEWDTIGKAPPSKIGCFKKSDKEDSGSGSGSGSHEDDEA